MNEKERATEIAYKFLAENKLGVLATVWKCKPRVATVYYFMDSDRKIYFFTKTATRKYEAIMVNKNVGFVVGTVDEPVSVQIDAEAEMVTESDEEVRLVNELLEVATSGNSYWPAIMRIGGDPSPKVFELKPTWMRLYDARGLIGNSPEENAKAFVQIYP